MTPLKTGVFSALCVRSPYAPIPIVRALKKRLVWTVTELMLDQKTKKSSVTTTKMGSSTAAETAM